MINLNIDGIEVTASEGQTILSVAKENGIDIPTLCHDERVKPYGSCGMCVIEAQGSPRLLRACSTIAVDGMILRTNTERVRQTRKTALELLLSDHTGDCRPPCVLACPGQTDCQGYVGLIANKQYKEALMLIKDRLPLPASIGRVCPHPCETACRRQLVEEPIDIAHLKYFVADQDLASGTPYRVEPAPDTNKSVAIIGGGPGGLSAAYFLRAKGHAVTIYDAMPKMGGMLRYGIPEYRLPKAIVDAEVKLIEDMGVKMVNNIRIGKDLNFDYIRQNHHAVIVAIGAWASMSLRCKGEELEGVIGGIDFLRQVALDNVALAGKKIAVVGGGNTAMDACRTAVRLGAEAVYTIYRRTKAEMPAEAIEIAEAEEEGVIFKYLSNPIELKDNGAGHVGHMRLQQMALGEPDASGRRSPVPIDGAEETLDVDTVIIAIGQGTDTAGFESLELTKRGTITVHEKTFCTNLKGVFAIGDATNQGAYIAIAAIGEAKKASEAVHAHLNGIAIHEYAPLHKEPYLVKSEVTKEQLTNRERAPRIPMRHQCAAERKNNFTEVNKGFTEREAIREASRCLECGCHDYFECELIRQANDYDVHPELYPGDIHRRTVADTHPFIKRNPDKCILCGLCVRVCDETMGVTALGLFDRGFDAMVKPAFDLPLKETGCISCGQCVTLCPTGALTEITGAAKQTPVKEFVNHTICNYCSLGCRTKLTTAGEMLLRSIPDETANSQMLLCAKGRFGLANPMMKNKARLTKPLIRQNGQLTETSFDDAYIYIVKKLNSFRSAYGSGSIALSVSDNRTNEEIYAIKKYGQQVLQTDKIISFNRKQSGLEHTLGIDASTTTMDEMLNSDLVFVIEKNIFASHTIAAVKLKQAVENQRLKLITLNNSKTYLDGYADIRLDTDNSLEMLRQILKALIDMGGTPEPIADGFEALESYVAQAIVSDAALAAAQAYAQAKNAVILFEQNELSTDAALLISAIALTSGHIARPRNGIVQLKPNFNSQGLCDMGIQVVADTAGYIAHENIKSMMIFGEDLPDIDLSTLEFLVVQDTHLTETAEKADVVLPAASFYETNGSITNTFRKFEKTQRALPSACGFSNLEIIQSLANTAERRLDYRDENDLLKEIATTFPLYHAAATNSSERKPLFLSTTDMPLLYERGNKAKLIVPTSDCLYEPRSNTYAEFRKFSQFIAEEKVIQL